MAVLSTIRDGLKANLQTIADFANRAFDIAPSRFVAPCAIVGYPERIEYRKQLGKGKKATYLIPIRVYVAAQTIEAMQDKLDSYCDSSGDNSVTAALESDRTLGGAVDDLQVRMIRDYGSYKTSEGDVLGAEWVVEVIA